MRVAYTLEQCWHQVPGGTGVVALRTAQALTDLPGITLIGVAGRHPAPPKPPWVPTIPVRQLPIPGRPWLYEAWLRLGRPRVETATGPVDVAHATTIIPCPSRAPLVVTLHDLAFLHYPQYFTRRGVAVFGRSLKRIARSADLVLCVSQATMDDAARCGLPAERLRHVPNGVDATPATPADVARVRAAHHLPERYLLFVGTLEPRKNLRRLVAAIGLLDEPLPLVVAGADGWGDQKLDVPAGVDVRFLGFVPDADLAGLYAGAEVFCYPSEWEGFGLPVGEAMAQGVAVVTSRGTATEEVAGGVGVLVDPLDVTDIARGIDDALRDRPRLAAAGPARAAELSWRRTAMLTAAAYREVAR